MLPTARPSRRPSTHRCHQPGPSFLHGSGEAVPGGALSVSTAAAPGWQARGLFEADIDALALVAPEEFVAARGDLVRRLKAAGDKAQAAEVAKRRRPTVPDWLGAQVRQNHPSAVSELRAASQEVARAQAVAITTGDRRPLRQATAQRREAMAVVARSVSGVLAATGRPAHHGEVVTSAIEAAIIAEVATGGFGLPADVELPERSSPPRPPTAIARDEPEVAAERAETARAETARAEAEAAVAVATERVAEARGKLRAAEGALASAEERRRRLTPGPPTPPP